MENKKLKKRESRKGKNMDGQTDKVFIVQLFSDINKNRVGKARFNKKSYLINQAITAGYGKSFLTYFLYYKTYSIYLQSSCANNNLDTDSQFKVKYFLGRERERSQFIPFLDYLLSTSLYRGNFNSYLNIYKQLLSNMSVYFNFQISLS